MTSDRNFKWRYGTEIRVKDVEEAIELADGFRKSGKYNWFRGQTKTWPPHSALMRAHLNGKEAIAHAQMRLSQLSAFMKLHVELRNIASDTNAFFAVAQHYGIPTAYIDFTTEPAIAGFFACDTSNPDVGSDSCIYCLNTSDLKEVWENLAAIRTESEIELVTDSVPNLWRLESQHGVFLYCQPANWDSWYEMDRIVFPYRGYPPYPPRNVIYPTNKSSLESLLDHFFVEERRAEGQRNLLQELKKVSAHILTDDGPPEYFTPKFFKSGQIEPHPSWNQSFLEPWVDKGDGAYQSMHQQQIILTLDPSWSALEMRRRTTTAVAGALRMRPTLRGSLVSWDFGSQAITPHDVGNKTLQHAVEWLWDGMRRLPYTDSQIASSIGVCVQLSALGLLVEAFPQRQKEIASEAFGSAIEIEFGGFDGSYSRAYASEKSLREAMRDDLLELVQPNHKDMFQDTRSIFLAVFAPKRLFDFSHLCELFAEQIIAWQVIARRGRVAFFAPSRLRTFGIP